MWDNMFRILLMNLGYTLWLFLFFYVPIAARFPLPFFIATEIAGFWAILLYTGAVSSMAADIADYKQPGFADFFGYVKKNFASSSLYALVQAGILFLCWTAFNFYGSIGSFFGTVICALLLWLCVGWILICQYYYPIQGRLDKNFRKVFRKMFILFFDNQLFSVGLLMGSLVVFLCSIFTAGLLPGITTILVWYAAALKLRLLKYDYLEKNPSTDRKKIPWDSLLVEERERVGKRTFKGLIFPWKE